MSTRVALRHVTTYAYDRTVTLLPHTVRLRPAPHARTPIAAYSLKVEPADHFLNWQQDPYSNWLARVVVNKPAAELRVTVDLVADLVPINPFDFFVDEYAEEYPFRYDATLARELVPYLEVAPAGPRLQPIVDALRGSKLRTVDFLVELNQAIYRKVTYIVRPEPGVQTPEETLEKGSGSCRDSGWLLVQLCRHLGLAARFCSGYLIQLVADEKPVDGPDGPAADFTDLHAWAEVYVPGAGWVGLDPTSGLLAAEGHIPLACTADPQSAAPVTGSYAWTKRHDDDAVEETFRFDMAVTRMAEKARPSKPYTDGQWAAIDALGRHVDAHLAEWDVRLTVGGEPTFVSAVDRQSAEWHVAALGPGKRRQAMHLAKRLRDRFAPTGLLHFGQGKWYPGESLPRWAFGLWWRRDGEPVWADPALVADEDVRYGYDADTARAFVEELARRLDITAEHVMPGYEDAWYYMWKERRLPANVDPLASKLDDPEERARLARVFERGLNAVVGHALPLRKGFADGRRRWQTGPWFVRPEHLFLIPGDSPMGFRLPLGSLPWEPEGQRQGFDPADPFAPRGPLPTFIKPQYPYPAASANKAAVNGRDGRTAPPFKEHGTAPAERLPAWVVRTALCVEPRDGKLYVFMPPTETAEDYLELVAAVESTAAAVGTPVLVEGYRPPADPRLNHLSVTPDPGVVEANVHPAHSWAELTDITSAVYEEAKQARLCPDKFLLDGRHVGSGGGNHVVLGGPTPADSPFLRRPDLLASLVGFWNNHPSLSYLFSGLFVGPTSQHPRVDEARHDTLYELDIAVKKLAESGRQPPAWLVDRTFRNLLVDVTGNTHRTEFCIDKLYSPDTASGRMGLVELRSFEMPPHPQMSLAQQLLVRACVAWFWRQPYRRPLVRWGTEVHDRFMLPHYVWADFTDVLDELNRAGYGFDPEWFAPHFEFKFPKLGEVSPRGVTLELRTAIEPWHVLGEEPGAGGAARYVDSSVERVQVKAAGLTDPRHVLTCNGRRLPLRPTGTNGEFVAGVRFRAWQPPSCLHPTIPVHGPLVFDLIDTWNDRSVGGCVYHVAHPGGRGLDDFPVNGREAEGRRLARFAKFGHTSGPVSVPPLEVLAEFPHTLDLRQPAPPTYAPPPEPGVTNRVAARLAVGT